MIELRLELTGVAARLLLDRLGYLGYDDICFWCPMYRHCDHKFPEACAVARAARRCLEEARDRLEAELAKLDPEHLYRPWLSRRDRRTESRMRPAMKWLFGR